MSHQTRKRTTYTAEFNFASNGLASRRVSLSAMARGLLEGRAELEALFDELAHELDQVGATAQIVMVGAWMLWHSQRMSTRDIDSARKLGSETWVTSARLEWF